VLEGALTSPSVCVRARYTFNADIWSLGISLIEMATAKTPFNDFSNPCALMFHIGRLHAPPPLPACNPPPSPALHTCARAHTRCDSLSCSGRHRNIHALIHKTMRAAAADGIEHKLAFIWHVLICYSACGEVRCDGKHLGWTRASLRVHSALSTSALAFLQACLEVDSHQRCSAEELSLHAFIVTDSTRAHTHTRPRAHTHTAIHHHPPHPTALRLAFFSNRDCARRVLIRTFPKGR
jgi:serine/threonine protein kinase